jgi:hypothetical protein
MNTAIAADGSSSIALTGPRRLTPAQQIQVEEDIKYLLSTGSPRKVHVGDATGLDALAWKLAVCHNLHTYHKKFELPGKAQGAERSTRMIKAILADGGTLHAWPAQPAPPKLMPSRSWPKNAEGSGTWGTVALAVGLGVPVELHPLTKDAIAPEWLPANHQAQQLQLI